MQVLPKAIKYNCGAASPAERRSAKLAVSQGYFVAFSNRLVDGPEKHLISQGFYRSRQ